MEQEAHWEIGCKKTCHAIQKTMVTEFSRVIHFSWLYSTDLNIDTNAELSYIIEG